MATITPAQAQDMIYRSMITGVPTSEFDAAGGYDAVYSLAKSAGGDMGAPSAAAIQQYGPTVTAQGYGNTSYAPGGANNPTGGSSALQKQLAELQAKYDALTKKGATPTTGPITGGGGGGLVDTSTSANTTAALSSSGTTGVVYGPDGTMYSSPAAALAAGVKNFTTTKPVAQSSSSLLSPAGTPGTAAGGFMLGAAQTGNVNPGGLISGANQQLFTNKVGVQMPPNY